MDSHPHIVISHELDVFTKLSEGILSPIKQDIFNASMEKCHAGHLLYHGSRVMHDKGYDLLVDGLYQGKYVTTLT